MLNDAEEINNMLIRIRDYGENLTKWEEDFIDSIEEQWSEKKWISEKQEHILEKIYKEKAK